MDRRTDRTIGLVTIIAIAFIPTATLSLVKIGNPFEAGRAIDTEVTPVSEDYPGAPKPFVQAPVTSPALPAAPPPPAQQAPPPPQQQFPKPATVPTKITSFDRLTNLVTFQVTGNECLQEKATFTLPPKFTMRATTVRSKWNGKKCVKKFSTTVVTIKGNTRKTRVGSGPVKTETLTSFQLDEILINADPHTLTRLVKNYPGVQKARVKKTSFYTYTINGLPATIFYPLLPSDYRDKFPITALSGLNVNVSDLAVGPPAKGQLKDVTVLFQMSGVGMIGGAGLGVAYTFK
ncbi:hypothetical protein [Actinocorallia longicatena]|uniref:Uncharacterized protein n=1 Tax=Actinocorallia longicatena TaxID=111803 RepID=A0ABP6QP94_9ACTN